MNSPPKISIIIFVCFLCGLTCCIDLCSKDEEFNLTYYKDPKIQTCGCEHSVCIRKCCRAGFYLSKNRTCLLMNTSDTFEIPVYKKKTILSKIITNEDNFKVGVLECRYFRMNNDNPNDTYFVQENGSLWVPRHNFGVLYGNSEYCVDERDGLSVYVCFAQEDPMAVVGRDVNLFGMIISMPFLLITFLVYAILPDRNLHQRALMFYVLTLLLSYVLLVTINLVETLSSPWCELFGYSTLFFFMVSFFWMNVICFDIWYTFSGGRGFVGSKRSSETRRLIFYSIYAFGVPIAVVALVLIMQKVLPEDSPHNPGIGKSKCFIADGWPNLWYFYVEAGILVITNIVFFLLTAIKIRQVKKETSMLKHNDSRRHSYEKDKQKFNLYVKLLFAMGVNWSMEVISFLVNWRTGGTIQYIWYATDFFNAVYGVFIFFIFVFKKKIWTLLQRRYYNFIGKPHLAHTMTSSNTRTSHYSSTNYSTADTSLSDRTTVINGRARAEELALRPVT